MRLGGSVSADTDSHVAAGGTLAGNFSSGGYAQLGSIGDSSPAVNAGGNIYISSLGLLTPTLAAGGNIRMISFGSIGTGTDATAGKDITEIWSAGPLSGTFIADHAIGDVTSYDAINASFNAGDGGSNTTNDPTFGVIQSVQAWGAISGSITASEAINSITSRSTVSARLSAPTVGTVTQNDTGIFSSYPTTPEISVAGAQAALKGLANAITQAQAGLAAQSQAMNAAVAANQAVLSQAAGQIIAQNQQAQSAAQAAVVAGNQEVKANIAAANGEATTLLAQAQQSLAANLANAKATDAQLDGQFQDSINQAKNTNSANASTVGTALTTYENAVATRSAEQQQFTQAQRADFQQAQAQQKASWVQTDSQNFTSIAHTIVTDLESGAGWVWGHVTGWFGATVSWVENHPLNAALTGASLTPIAGNFIAATDDAFHGHWGWALVDVGFVALDFDGMGEAEAAARVAKDVAEDAVKAAAENAVRSGLGTARALGQAGENAVRAAYDIGPQLPVLFLATAWLGFQTVSQTRC